MPIFFVKNCEELLQCKSSLIFSTKSISVFGYKVIKHLRSRPLTKLVKLMMLSTTGPCMFTIITLISGMCAF